MRQWPAEAADVGPGLEIGADLALAPSLAPELTSGVPSRSDLGDLGQAGPRPPKSAPARAAA